jgi:RNA polymerase sigma factor (sigma-70 family)
MECSGEAHTRRDRDTTAREMTERARVMHIDHRSDFVRTARAALFGFARDQAQDLVSEVIADVGRGAFPALPDVDRRAMKFVQTVIRYRARHINRCEARMVSFDEEQSPIDLVDGWERCAQIFLVRDVTNSLARLPARQREVASLHWLEQRSCPEIAARLGITVRTVKELLRRARRSLRAKLAHHRSQSID